MPYNNAMNWLYKTWCALWLRARSLLINAFLKPSAVSGQLYSRAGKIQYPFIAGANLPWLHYGCDFGANAWNPGGGVSQMANREVLFRILRQLRERGMQTIRWFLLCDGRSGIRFSKSGTPIGPDRHLFSDIEAALEIAAACDVKIVFVLLDFLWCGQAAHIHGIQVRGRAGVLRSTYRQQALRRRILKPIFKLYGRSPVILAWDIINEPEWVTAGFGAASGTALACLAMRRFIKKTARLIHRHTEQLATAGLGSTAGLPLVRNTGLDFYQVHWYDRWDAIAPLDRPVPEWNLDRPLLLGEFPTKNSSRRPQDIFQAAKNSGYCGAMAWSVLGTDRFSGIDLAGNEPASQSSTSDVSVPDLH